MQTRKLLMSSAAVLALTVGSATAETVLKGDATIEDGAAANTDMKVASTPAMSSETGQSTTPYWNDNLERDYASVAAEPIERLIGMRVFSEGGEDLGEIDNFILGPDNKIEAVVGVGGFLGLGEHDVAIALEDMRYDENDRVIVIKFSETEIENMPEFTEEYASSTFEQSDMLRDGPSSTREMAEADTDVETEITPGDEVAEAEQALENTAEDAEQVAENAAEETGEALNAAGEEVADAADATGQALENTAEDAEQVAENAAEETGEALNAAGEEVADAADATGQALENTAEDAEQVAENAVEETGEAMNAAGEEVADAANATGEAIENTAEDAVQMTENAAEATGEALENTAEDASQVAENAAEETGEWMQMIENEFAQIADWTANDLQGTNVASASGEVIGEVDYVGTRQSDGELVAIVGIGGFLGLMEHEVALAMTNMNWDGERLVVEGYSEAELREMPEYSEDDITFLDDTTTLRSYEN